MAMNGRLLRPRATGFNPKSIANLAVWVDFSDTSTVTLDSSSKISAVTDKSGAGAHGTQTTAANRLAVSTLNGRQCADNGTSSNAFCVQYSGNNLNYRDGFVVGVWDAGGTTFPEYNSFISTPAIAGTAGGGLIVGQQASANFFGSTAWHSTAGSVSRLNNTAVANGGTLNAFAHIKSTFVYRGHATSDIAVTGWQIGCDRSLAGRGWRGRIGEVLIYTRQLSDSEALKVRQYLANKWGAPSQT